MKRTLSPLLFVFLLAGLLAVGTASVSAQDPGPGDINLTIEPSDSTVAPNTNQTYDVVVEGPDKGIGAYNQIAVDVGDSSVVEIVSFQENKTSATSQSGIQDNGTSLVLDTALLSNRYGAASELAIAEFTVEAVGSAGDSTSVAYNQSAAQTVAKNSNLRGSNEPVEYNVTAFNDASIAVETPPDFQVSDLTPQTATVENGTAIDISANITNAGGVQGTQTVTLTVGGMTQTTQVTLAGGATDTVVFQNVDTGVFGPGSYAHTIATENDAVSGSLTVQASADFQLSDLDPATATTVAGDLLDISANVTNTGDVQGAQTVTLTVGSVSRQQSVTVAGGAVKPVAFTDIDTGALGPGSYTHEIATANDTVSGSLTVQAPANLQLANLNPANGTAVAGDKIDISATVENTGDIQANQTVTLNVGSISRQQSVTIPGGEFQVVTFTDVRTGQLGPGEYTHEITTANDSISGTLTVQAPANFSVSGLQPADATVDNGDIIDISATLTNVGDVQGTQTVTLTVDGITRTSAETLNASESGTVTFENVLIDIGPGTYTPTVSTANGTVSGNLTVLEQATVELRPTESEVRVTKNTTVQVVIDGATSGISSYDLNVSLNNTAASILDYQLTAGSGATDSSAIRNNGKKLSLAATGTTYAASSEVVIANLTVRFGEVGTTRLRVPAGFSITDGNQTAYDTARQNTTLSTFGPPPLVDGRLPQDPDNDSLYDDVRGDGRVDVLDVQSLFNNLNDPTLQTNARFFYFNVRPNPQEVSILDVQALFNRIQGTI
jgi:hypothetical protein